MTWIHSLFAFRNARHIQDASEQLVVRVWPWGWQRLDTRVVYMTPAEARGYVRAHSGELVRAGAASVVEKHESLREWAEESIVEQTLEGLVTLCLAEVVKHQRQFQRQSLRRAA